MIALRSALFSLWLYLSMAIFAVGLSPALLMPHRHARGVVKLWARFVLFGLRWICDVRVEVRGRERRPAPLDVAHPDILTHTRDCAH